MIAEPQGVIHSTGCCFKGHAMGDSKADRDKAKAVLLKAVAEAEALAVFREAEALAVYNKAMAEAKKNKRK